jgi:DNA-binding transcriptional LysR family regulator
MNVHEYLEFRHLKYIIAIAETGTFTAAAARLHVSQSAISAQIAALEDQFGFQIFDRENANALTTEGRILLRYGLESLRTREHIVQTLKAIHAGTLVPLRLGFTPFVEKTLLRSVTNLYRELLLDCEIVAETGDTDEIASRVRQDDLHAAIVTLPIRSDDLEVTVLEREPLVVLMRSDDPLTVHAEIPLSTLNQTICIFTYQRHHPAAYDQLVAMFHEVGITPLSCKPTMNIEHVQWMVNEGGCYSLLRASQPLHSGLVTRPIAGVDWTIDSAFISRAGRQHPALSLFTQELRKHFRVASQIPEKKSVASVGVRDGVKRAMGGHRVGQSSLFDNQNELGDQRHMRKQSGHRKELLDE